MEKEIIEKEQFSLASVDCFEENNTLWFRLSDIGNVLEMDSSSVRKMKQNGWFDEDEISNVKNIHGGKDITYVSESALYRILNRSNSPKAKPFERWVTKEVIPSIRKTGSYSIPKKSQQEIDNETKQLNLAEADYWRSLADRYSDNKNYEQILLAYSTKAVAGEFVLPLPELAEKNYSATEVGKQLGISANKVGKIANRLGIKIDGEYGKWYVDKARNSNREVNTFRYTQKAIDVIKKDVS